MGSAPFGLTLSGPLAQIAAPAHPLLIAAGSGEFRGEPRRLWKVAKPVKERDFGVVERAKAMGQFGAEFGP